MEPQTGTAGRDILEDINTSASSPRRNACSRQIKKAPNARVAAGENDGRSETLKYRNAGAKINIVRSYEIVDTLF